MKAVARCALRANAVSVQSPLDSRMKPDRDRDITEVLFHLTCKQGARSLTMKIAASEESPIVDPAFVVNNWGYGSADLQVNGRAINHGKDFCVGHRERLDGTDLIIWFRCEADEPGTVRFIPGLGSK